MREFADGHSFYAVAVCGIDPSTAIQGLFFFLRGDMTRREKRFIRRREKRENKRSSFLKKYDDYSIIYNRDNLFQAAELAKKNVLWKASVQNWSIHQLLETERLHRDLVALRDVRKGFSKFVISERGKQRNISAVRFYERVAQKCLCQKVLYPAYTRSLIYDNAASQKGKGVKFAMDRFTTHLRRHFKKHGRQGYVLLVDFKGYFENIDHEALKRIYRRLFQDESLLLLIDRFVDAYGSKGLGLGSETSQMHAIMFPNIIDHAITETLGEKVYFGRYMDDSYIITHKRETLLKALSRIKSLCSELRITLSPKKTKIVALKNCIKWLKTRIYLTESGKIIKKPCRDGITRQRKKLKGQIKLYNAGKIGVKELERSFESWAGSMKRRNARRTVFNMRLLLRKVKEYEKKRNRSKNKRLQQRTPTKGLHRKKGSV